MEMNYALYNDKPAVKTIKDLIQMQQMLPHSIYMGSTAQS